MTSDHWGGYGWQRGRSQGIIEKLNRRSRLHANVFKFVSKAHGERGKKKKNDDNMMNGMMNE